MKHTHTSKQWFLSHISFHVMEVKLYVDINQVMLPTLLQSQDRAARLATVSGRHRKERASVFSSHGLIKLNKNLEVITEKCLPLNTD